MSKNKKKFIGVFDFGFGGINILREIVKELPVYNYLYLGDTTRAPYGTRSKEVVYVLPNRQLILGSQIIVSL
jgi:glutamate racemase